MVHKSIAAVLAVLFCAFPAFSQQRDRKTNAAASFDMPSYLAALSAEGKERGYQEFVYKQTPQGELRIYFAMPAGWSPSDKRPVMVFLFGGCWTGGRGFAFVKEAEHL